MRLICASIQIHLWHIMSHLAALASPSRRTQTRENIAALEADAVVLTGRRGTERMRCLEPEWYITVFAYKALAAHAPIIEAKCLLARAMRARIRYAHLILYLTELACVTFGTFAFECSCVGFFAKAKVTAARCLARVSGVRAAKEATFLLYYTLLLKI